MRARLLLGSAAEGYSPNAALRSGAEAALFSNDTPAFSSSHLVRL